MHAICNTPNARMAFTLFLDLSRPAKERTLPAISKETGVSLSHLKGLCSREKWRDQLRAKIEALPSAGTASVMNDLGTALHTAANSVKLLDELATRVLSLAEDDSVPSREKTRKLRTLKTAIAARRAVHQVATGSVTMINGLLKKREELFPRPLGKPALPAGGSSHVDVEPGKPDCDSLLFDDEY
jgi:hypothetical protein